MVLVLLTVHVPDQMTYMGPDMTASGSVCWSFHQDFRHPKAYSPLVEP